MALPFTRRWSVFVLVAVTFVVIVTLISDRARDSVSSVIYYPPSVFNNLQNVANCVKNKNAHWKTINPDTMTPTELVNYLNWANQTSCGLTHDFGGKMLGNPPGYDGQKAICLNRNVAPMSGKCVVYSFGISNEWSFDEAMETYGCQVFAFDPSMGKDNHQHSRSVAFYNLGLGDKSVKQGNGWVIKTLSDIHKMLRPIHGDVDIDYLKMDIEQNEWNVLKDIMKSGMLRKIRQLGVEFHLSGGQELEEFRSRVKIIKSLEDLGFIRFDSKYNPWFKGNITGINSTVSLGYEIAWYQHLPY